MLLAIYNTCLFLGSKCVKFVVIICIEVVSFYTGLISAMTGSLWPNNWKSKQTGSFQALTLNTDPSQHDRQTKWNYTTQVPGRYICYWCTTERATDTDSIISSPRPNNWRGTGFTSTEIPAKTLRQLGELLARRTRSKKEVWLQGWGWQASVEKLGWKPCLISHEHSEVAACALQALSQPLLSCVFFSLADSVSGWAVTATWTCLICGTEQHS